MPPIISISNLTKTYASGLQALKNINLEIRKSEIFALLGPNGAGKTTLINIVCGIVTATEGAGLAVVAVDAFVAHRDAAGAVVAAAVLAVRRLEGEVAVDGGSQDGASHGDRASLRDFGSGAGFFPGRPPRADGQV